jgi:hypothetical protein
MIIQHGRCNRVSPEADEHLPWAGPRRTLDPKAISDVIIERASTHAITKEGMLVSVIIPDVPSPNEKPIA